MKNYSAVKTFIHDMDKFIKYNFGWKSKSARKFLKYQNIYIMV